MAVRRRVVVHGDVQGVFFRDTCQREAARSGVSGWIRNNPDGSVEAVFEADDEEAVATMIRWARTGPDGAQVGAVDEHPEEPEGLSGFDVR